MIVGIEPVGGGAYVAGAGWDYALESPTYELEIHGPESARFPYALSVSGALGRSSQAFEITAPIWGSTSGSASLTLGYERRSTQGKALNSVVVGGAFSTTAARDLSRASLAASARARLFTRTWPTDWRPELSANAVVSVRLPFIADNSLSFRAAAGWTGSDASEDALYLGGHSSAYRNVYPVRGIEVAEMGGRSVLTGGIEYAMKLGSLEFAPAAGPLFIDDVCASVFVDAGATADNFVFKNAVLTVGAELGMTVVPGYTSGETKVSVGVAQPIASKGTAPTSRDGFIVYVKTSSQLF